MSDKVIVFGSNSFSGAHFVNETLDAGMDVVGISRSSQPDSVFLPYTWQDDSPKKFQFFKYDLNTDLQKIMAVVHDFRPDYFVNFSSQSMVAQSWEYPEHWFKTNTISTVLLHDQLRQCRFLKKYIHISTPEVYGSCEGSVKEDASFNPSTPYAVSRAAADMSLKTFFDNYKFPVIFTRAANVYGPGQQLYRIVPRAILFFMMGRQLSLHGGGVSVRSFIHIKDVVKGTIAAMLKSEPGQAYHFSSSPMISIKDLVEKIADAVGVAFKDHVKITGERPGKDMAYILDSSKAIEELSWQSEINLDQGIMETINWVKENFDILKQQPLDYIHKE